jgi:hypothetical protein
MARATLERIQQDGLAMSIARAVNSANDAAVAHGTNPSQALVTISEETSAGERLWRVHYGPRDYLSRRGGDLIIIIDDQAAEVRKIIRGQ